MTKTQLRIFKNGSELPLPPGSYRFLTFSKKPINEAIQQRRAMDGTLVNLGYAEMLRYEISISCNDQKIPPLSNVVPGSYLTIHSPEVMSEPGPAITLDREPVPGSIQAFDASGVLIAEPEGRTLNVPGAAYFEYRPIFNVMVGPVSSSSKDMKAQVSWSLTAQEWEPASGSSEPATGEQIDYVEASGGVVSEYEDSDGKKWRVHTFNRSDVFDVTEPGEVELLIIGGGGGGGVNGGGGGAGAFPDPFSTRAEVGIHSIVVGAGGPYGISGSGGTDSRRHGKQGSASSAFGHVSSGGGGGLGATRPNSSTKYGGSGGGRAHHSSSGYPGIAGTGEPYRGHDGGNTTVSYVGGGGGGAGGHGGANIGSQSGDGGLGKSTNFFGDPVKLAGGGAGGSVVSGSAEAGGGLSYTPGDANTGGGGGGAHHGGSGLVAIRYRIL